jgi:glycosyltransferase involved in cell wall biosynthesis
VSGSRAGAAPGTRRPTTQPDASPKGPLLPDIGVVGLVPERFGVVWQPRHQVMTRLAKYFHVTWVEPARSWREAFAPGYSPDPVLALPEGFMVHDPSRSFPKFYRPGIVGEWTARARLRSAIRTLRRKGCRKVVLYVWRPEFADDLDRGSFDALCYHVDDEYSFSDKDQPVSDRELRLLREADQVFLHSPALIEKKGKINPNTTFVPNGVDYQAFATPVPEPPDLEGIPRPRIGYVGYLKKQLDWDLLEALADRHPKWSFVFVGPRHSHPGIQDALTRMEGRPNVHLLGTKSISEIGAYPQHFDVSILPYAVNDYTRYINPLKLYEYLAAGPPIIGVPIRTLEDFSDTVALASGVDEWSAALERALGPDEQSPARTASRQELARQFEWDLRVRTIAEKIAESLGEVDVLA